MENIKDLMTEGHELIKPHIHRTPVLSSRLVNAMVDGDIVFKCENFQRMGAFKMRGAAHALLRLHEDQKNRGVVTHSSGNFAQALSLAAKRLGIQAFIVMPSNATQIKKDAVLAYGGTLIECEPTLVARAATALQIQKETGATFIHPSNDKNVILGQGTAAMELLLDCPKLEYIVVPVGGGGLLAGTALAAFHFGHHCKVLGGEPKAVDDAYRSFKSGKIEMNTTADTIADGLRTQLGDLNFPIIQKYVNGIIRVSEDEIVHAMRLVWERMKIVVEPSSAVALAAVFAKKEKFRHKKIGIIISGGNVDLNNLPF